MSQNVLNSMQVKVAQQTLMRLMALTVIAFASITVVASAQNAKGDRPSSLPGGASSLTETFQDWTVSCASLNGETQCVVTQTQTQQQTGQQVLDIRLSPVQQDKTYQGNLALPFGLEFTRGVTMQLDDGQIGKPFSFKTCLPAGCIVPISFDKFTFDALRKGTSLKLAAISIDNQNIPFAVSLKGFGAAFDRASALVAAK
ncbi:invasion associated locus B family protein [Ochrobactrum quorumnocens]|uniref:Invasion associated locus B family protein n=1 Tax=Ochrobactrum quorumnocens TaxID=271865 RepID=A0A5N1JFQ7_9HYPH|nr:invasion associated locus B family protein [[Ochrobactrum] quorumnocens]KAA9353275.1 invasion associated locus B family protein [[Ochrobactrum] quorumnocens]